MSCLSQGIASLTEIKKQYESDFPKEKPKSLHAYIMASKRLGIDKQQRDESLIDFQKKEVAKDIREYPQVKSYVLMAESSGIQQTQIIDQQKLLRKLWQIMGATDPTQWTYEALLSKLSEVYPQIEKNGRKVFVHPTAVRSLLGAYNTMFPGRLMKGFGSGLNVHDPGTLKDYFTFAEMQTYDSGLIGDSNLSTQGWKALFKTQVNLGCREGTTGINGILSLKWENIDYNKKRCCLVEKGGRGKAHRLWKNLPLDLFPWLDGWGRLLIFHLEKFGYIPNSEKHESGKVFEVAYDDYRKKFHETRLKANGRISGALDTMKPHVFRKTHAQWLVKLGYHVEQICGSFPDGYLGVGWDNPTILLKYYVTLDLDSLEESNKIAAAKMGAMGLL